MKDYKEEDYLMISGIQHFKFCRRQWALIHIEQQWDENVRTFEGELMHERAHKDTLKEKQGVSLFGYEGEYTVYPVEYKRGAPRDDTADMLQLTAQAMCLEEMMSTQVLNGALYYGQTKRRQKVAITKELREEVKGMFLEMHRYFSERYTPMVKWKKGCNACLLPSVHKGAHAPSHDICPIFCVILNRRTVQYASFVCLENQANLYDWGCGVGKR